ncbi:hypothetical protein NLI96_g11330 [Meripilus lineatus]|uniref:F-box domain-containing protein n=1 Tax=Meripilus lineatus TaxID=2056292 RepID=A0AAD5US24_9APHY|nr:hypothetical protein NLI96_g11330 [Physisporinus lineatus]
MAAGAVALETPEPVTDVVTLPLPNRTLELPPEVWERAIGWIPFYRDAAWGFGSPSSRATLVACTLVCRSWLHKSQRLLFPTVVLTDANKAKSFLAALKTLPSLGEYVVTLHIGPLKQDSDGTSKPPNSCSWIYPLLNILPPLLPGVFELNFQNLPPMHKSFFALAPQFKSVTSLFLEGLASQSFSEIIRLVNKFPHLQRLRLNKCQWRQPAHFYSGIKHRLQKIEIWTDDNCKMNVPKWLSASYSTSALTRLYIEAVYKYSASSQNGN